MKLEQMFRPDWLPPLFLHPQPIPAQAPCRQRQKWPCLFVTGALYLRDVPQGRQGGNLGHCCLGSCVCVQGW